MTVQNACLIFILAFSGITGWLLLREPAEITVTVAESTASEQVAEPNSGAAADEIPEVSLSDHRSLVRSKLDKIVIPVLDLQDITIEEAIDFLRLRSRELASDSTAPAYGVSFIIRKPRLDSEVMENDFDDDLDAGASTPTSADQLINIYAENISITEALDLICKKTDCHWEIDDHHVVILPN